MRDAEQVVGGHAIFEAMGAAGIHRDIAGDRAGELARRIRRIEEPVVATAWLMPRLVTPACTRMKRSARLTSRTRFILATPSTMASSCGMAPPESEVPAPRGTTLTPFSWQNRRTADDFRGRRGQHHRQRHPAIGRQPVGLEGASLIFRDDEGLPGNEPPKSGQDFSPA